MIRTLLIKVGSDPRKSPRPAEAVRIGAGVGAWNKVQVDLLLEGPGVHCLDEFADELNNGELFLQYLPAILNHSGRIIVDDANPILNSIKPQIGFERLDAKAIAQLTREVDHVMTF
jgi:hypothetical protein